MKNGGGGSGPLDLPLNPPMVGILCPVWANDSKFGTFLFVSL